MSSGLLNDGQRAAREFAVDVVKRLRAAGFEALWAGGCVRDSLLGKIPKDYDVASSATPEQVIGLFGVRRTVPVGASFGVVMVLGPTALSGQVEVAAFRSDGQYIDGRRPESVRYSTPAEDAARRDFTINGMFYDPLADRVIDYVGGREDLAAGVVRAIGNPADRFAEDKLRMLRAVRFTAAFGFEMDSGTETAIRHCSRHLNQVSIERITQELRRMLAHFSRERSFRLLHQTQLLPAIFPAVFGTEAGFENGDLGVTTEDRETRIRNAYQLLASLSGDEFEPALCGILLSLYQAGERDSLRVKRIREQCVRLKLSGKETDFVTWLAESQQLLKNASTLPLHLLKRILSDERVEGLLNLISAIARSSGDPPVDAEYCRRYLSGVSRERLWPAPLLNGRDLKEFGVAEGAEFGRILQIIRQEQLDELLLNRDQALKRLGELIQSSENEMK